MKRYNLTITIEDVISEAKKYHKVLPIEDIRCAYEFAKSHHRGVKRGTGEDYIMHPLRVAYKVASLGAPVSWIIAALLHDVVEDVENVSKIDISNMFNEEVAELVDAVTKIDKNQPPFDKLSRTERHNLTDIKLQSSNHDGAIIIKLADRIDNLQTIDGLKEEKRAEKAQHTVDILIPLAKMISAEELIDELENLCFQILHRDENSIICNAFDKYKTANLSSIKTTLGVFSHYFEELKNEDKSNAFLQNAQDFYVSKRSVCSIYRQITSTISNASELPNYLKRNNIAWYDMTLVTKECGNENMDSFFEFYENNLIQKGIYIIKTMQTTRKDSIYILLCDTYGNYFRLFIKTEQEYLYYRIGKLSRSYNNVKLQVDSEGNAIENYKKKIKVFSRDGEEMFITEGATVLDFAFLIHEEIGLHFDYAQLNGLPTHYQAHQVINEGDTVNILINSSEETAKLSWFKYLKTELGIRKLYNYFSRSKNLLKAYNEALEKEAL